MTRRRSMTDEERGGSEPVTLVPLNEAGAGEPGDASQQWEEFDTFRDQAETAIAGKRVWVYRIPTDPVGNPVSGVESALLFDAPLDTYTLSEIFARVKREYMPRGLGRCLIRIQVRQEKVRGVLWQKVIPIEKGLRDDAEATPPPTGDPNAGAIAQLAQAMNSALERQSQMIAQLFQAQRAAPQRDAFADSERIVAMITGLAGVLAKPQAAGPAANSMGDMLQAFREIRKLSLELAPQSGGGGDDDDDVNSIPKILSAGKPLIEMLTALIQRAPNAPAPGVRRLSPPQPQPRPMPPNPNAAGSVSVAPTIATPPPVNATMGSAAVTPQGNDPMLAQLAKHVSDICDLIEAGKAEPEGIARLILDVVPPEMDEKFYGIVADDFWLVKLKAIEPRVASHAEFFGKVRQVILDEFADEPDAPTAAP